MHDEEPEDAGADVDAPDRPGGEQARPGPVEALVALRDGPLEGGRQLVVDIPTGRRRVDPGPGNRLRRALQGEP